jgi:uncharacterized membrane protein YwaF
MKFLSDRKYAIAMLFFSMAYCYFTFSLEADFDPTKEKYFPFILSVAMIILSVLLFFLPSQHTTSSVFFAVSAHNFLAERSAMAGNRFTDRGYFIL